ncbi:NrdH-redoxin [Candidatus Kaiserbacteria bacterium CG10_big_fil_rev_8_21_14_0_10_43_70]|uniref:NrdH-redoxin n=1 Tax=Candidatus Kaiserbacteria bacterium CG10_big_fil_rev_8_21_14_0_10_43_70 TaxID=1974605 RepID=A0A2H0UJB6_9BACT|nr:MAG: NrdH-redoxin [Candidatus Kaiserbacteria bacterium CG10_big_fil_rev_8_21_14_0_10_43_70]
MKNVTIYSTPTCHFCHAAKEFFKENNIAFTDYDVSNDSEKRNEMLEKSGQMGVPVIFVDDPSNTSGQAEMIIGFDESKLRSLLDL